MGDFKDNDFYLEIKLRNGEYKHVMIPSEDSSVIYEYTSGNIIDKYTTKFNNRNELLDDIRKNGYADISNISNDDISSISFRYMIKDQSGCYSGVAYSDSLDVLNYLYGSNDYKKAFEENFKRYVVGRVVSDDKEYRKFLRFNFTRVYSNALRCDPGKFALGIYDFNLGGSSFVFSQYHNIRAHCLINHDMLNAKFELEREKKKGIPYDDETANDLREKVKNYREEKSKRSIIEIQKEYLGDRFVSYPKKEKIEYNLDNDIYEEDYDFETNGPLFIEEGIEIDSLPMGAGIQDQTEYTIDPDAYEEFLNNNPVDMDLKRRK